MNLQVQVQVQRKYLADISQSKRNNKKYKVVIYDLRFAVRSGNNKIKTLHFGDKGYQHYRDSTPLKIYSHLDHLDKDRKQKYMNRHSKIMKDGKPAYKNPLSPAYWSWHYLWS